jgi:hypothetical protein
MRDELLTLMREIYAGLKEKASLIGIDGHVLFAGVAGDIEKKVQRLRMAEMEPDEAE